MTKEEKHDVTYKTYRVYLATIYPNKQMVKLIGDTLPSITVTGAAGGVFVFQPEISAQWLSAEPSDVIPTVHEAAAMDFGDIYTSDILLAFHPIAHGSSAEIAYACGIDLPVLMLMDGVVYEQGEDLPLSIGLLRPYGDFCENQEDDEPFPDRVLATNTLDWRSALRQMLTMICTHMQEDDDVFTEELADELAKAPKDRPLEETQRIAYQRACKRIEERDSKQT